MNATILLNSGGGSASDHSAIERALSEAAIGGDPQWLQGSEIAAAAASAVERGAELVIAGGGDGTISAAAGALAGSSTRLGVMPIGTLNHFARDLQIPLDPADAARVIAAGALREIDVAEVNGRVFINNSAIGLYPLMVVNRDLQQRRLGRSKRLAMIVASARTLARFGRQRLALTVNSEKAYVDTPLLFVGNNEYGIDIRSRGRRESLQDGRLCVMVLRKKTRRGFVAAVLRALFERSRPDDMVRLDDVDRLLVGSRRRHLAVSVDGEVVRMATPLDYRIRPGALKVIAP